MIDLSRVQAVLLEDVAPLLEELDGLDVEDPDSVDSQTKSRERTFRAERSRELLFLADRLDLAAAFARAEYWTLKGERER